MAKSVKPITPSDRHSSPRPSSFHFDDVVVNGATFRIHKGDEIRTLAPRAFDLLIYLIEHGDRVVEKQELFEQVWGEAFVGDNSLTRAVKEIRHAIGDEADSPRYIQTVPKRGYRFIAELKPFEATALNENGASIANQPAVADLAPPRPSNDNKRVDLDGGVKPNRYLGLALTAGILVVAIIGFAIWGRRSAPAALEAVAVVRNEQITNWSGLDAFPAFSPDGGSIAYTSNHSGAFEIYVKSLIPGAKELQLTSDGQWNIEPTWSGDGRWIAYHSKIRAGIYTVAATGGISRQVTEFGSYPSWSRDGSLIAFQSSAVMGMSATAAGALPPSTIWTVSPKGGETKQITEVGKPAGGHGSPSWSASGKRIAFVAYDGTSCTIWSVSPDGTDLKRVVETAGWLYTPIYSPDERYLYYGGVSETGRFVLFRMGVSPATGAPEGKAVEVLDTGPFRIKQLSISPDGKKIAYSAPVMTGNLSSVTLSETGEPVGAPVNLTNDNSYRKSRPRFSPDGRKIAHVDFRGGTNQDIMVMHLDRNETSQLTTDPAVDWCPSWLPDGDQIVFESNRQGRQMIWSASLKSGRERVIMDPGQDMGWPAVSPDGREIAFHSRKSGTTNLWKKAIEGGTAVQLTFDKEAAGWPSWSPDGKLLAFQLRRGDANHVAVISSSGGSITQLTAEQEQNQPSSWSPDGDKIAFAGTLNGYWNIFWVSRSSGKQRQVTNYKSLDAYVRYAEWSPLGNQIVYEYAETKANIWLLELK